MEKVSKRVNAIQEVKESVSLLSQLLEGYSAESCSQSNKDLIKVVTRQHIETRVSGAFPLTLCVYRICTSAVRR